MASAASGVDLHGGDGILEGAGPLLRDQLAQLLHIDLLLGHVDVLVEAERDGVDLVAAGRGGHRDVARSLVVVALAVHYVGEVEALAVLGLDVRDVAPAHERVQVPILVDLVSDGIQQAVTVETFQVILQVRIILCHLGMVVGCHLRIQASSSGVWTVLADSLIP